MKLKYYMRGIGVGIVFSVLVFSLFDSGKQQMTEEEIIEAAKELGMEDKKPIDLSALAPTPMVTNNQEGLEENKNEESDHQEMQGDDSRDNEEESSNPKEDSLDEAEDSFNDQESLTTEETTMEVITPEPENGGTVTPTKELKTLVIQKGMNSHDVADLCESLGLVENAKEFDRYLIDQGYASSLRINQYEIPVGATYEEIAILITTTPQYK